MLHMERTTTGQVIKRALRLRCPVCGVGRLFHGMTMYESCSHCHFHFEREAGYFTNTVVVNYAVTALPILFIVAPLAYLHPHSLLLLIGLGFFFAIALPLLCFRHVRSLWLAIDVRVRPPADVEFTLPNVHPSAPMPNGNASK